MYKFYMACLCCLAGLAPATIVIDDFSTAQSVRQSSTYRSVTGPGILGQERSIETSHNTKVEINTTYPDQAHFSTTDDYLHIILYYDGIGSDQNGLNNMDLTEAGQNTGFRVSFADISPAEATFVIFVAQGSNQRSWLGFRADQAKDYFLPFADFQVVPLPGFSYVPVDFTNVGRIGLSTFSEIETVTLNSFEIVPEPATLSLLALGILALRRKS